MSKPIVIRVMVKRGGWVRPASVDRRKCPNKKKVCAYCGIVHGLIEVPIGKVWCLAFK